MPRFSSAPPPNCATVNAMPPNAPSGAVHMIMRMTPKMILLAVSKPPTTRLRSSGASPEIAAADEDRQDEDLEDLVLDERLHEARRQQVVGDEADDPACRRRRPRRCSPWRRPPRRPTACRRTPRRARRGCPPAARARARRSSRRRSSPAPAPPARRRARGCRARRCPTTTVRKITGAVIVLTSCRKASASHFASFAWSGATSPNAVPLTIATSTQNHSCRRKPRRGRGASVSMLLLLPRSRCLAARRPTIGRRAGRLTRRPTHRVRGFAAVAPGARPCTGALASAAMSATGEELGRRLRDGDLVRRAGGAQPRREPRAGAARADRRAAARRLPRRARRRGAGARRRRDGPARAGKSSLLSHLVAGVAGARAQRRGARRRPVLQALGRRAARRPRADRRRPARRSASSSARWPPAGGSAAWPPRRAPPPTRSPRRSTSSSSRPSASVSPRPRWPRWPIPSRSWCNPAAATSCSS